MRRFIAIICIVITGIANCFGQTYSGKIADANGKALGGVSVILLDAKAHPAGFGQSATNGTFAVKPQQGKSPQSIKMSKMGFETIKMNLSEFVDGKTYTLKEKTFELNEVRVTPDKAWQRGDTTTYLVSAYMQKQDRSIADVLKKIPGIEVRQDGQISVDGKAINKFYIEGMDLLGGKYSLASENLNAQKVSRVQVLHNHQPVRVLRDVNFSEQAALNIVLKDDARNVWQELIELSGGHTLQGDGSWLRDGRLLTMLFARKKQSISMFKTNNTGKDISREVSDLANENAETDDGAQLQNISLTDPTLDQQRYTFNNTNLFATNWLFKPNKDTDLRLQADGLIDKTEQNMNRTTTFIDTGADGVTVTENQCAFSKRNEWNGELLYKLNSDKTFVSNSLRGYVDFNYSRGLSMLNGTEVRQNVEPRKRYIEDNLRIIKNMSNSHSLSFTTRLHYGYLPGALLLQDGNSERLAIHNLLWNASSYFRHKLAGIYLTWRIGAEYTDQRQNIDNTMIKATDKYQRFDVWIAPSLSYKSQSFSIIAIGRTSFVHRRLGMIKRWQTVFQPTVMMEYKLNGYVSTNLDYVSSWSALSLSQLSDYPIFTDYMSLSQGVGSLLNSRKRMVMHSWRYSNPVHGLTGSVGFTYNHTSGIPLYNSSYTEGFYMRKANGEESDADSYILNGRISKAVGWGKLSIALSGTVNWYNYDLMVNNVRTPINQRHATTGIELSWHPLSWLSAEEKSDVNFNRQSSSSSSIEKTSLRYFRHKLNIFLMPGKWQIECMNEYYHSNDNTISNNYFCDMKASYRTKTYEVGVTCTNIFGTTNFERHIVNSYTRAFTMNVLRPRSILCFFSFSF